MKFTSLRHSPSRKWALPLALALFASVSFVRAADETVTPALSSPPSAEQDALTTIRANAMASAAHIVDAKGRPLISGIWLGEDGYLLTKSSEVPHLDQARVLTADGRLLEMREIRRDSTLDLALAQVKKMDHPPAVTKLVPATTVSFGQWLTTPARGGEDLCIGVLSAQTRKIPGMGAAIGVRMDDKSVGKAGGVRIIGIAEDSPAALAGLRADDILLELGGQTIARYKQVHEIISVRQPGEEIDVRFLRDGKEERISVRLASKTKILANWDGEDFANGGISIRTDNFAQVLQHDLPLGPRDMGAPLFDLEGHLVGINIARVDRVTTFALPATLFWPTVQQWLEADRHPPKAVYVKGVASVNAGNSTAAPASGPASRRVRLHRAR